MALLLLNAMPVSLLFEIAIVNQVTTPEDGSIRGPRVAVFAVRRILLTITRSKMSLSSRVISADLGFRVKHSQLTLSNSF